MTADEKYLWRNLGMGLLWCGLVTLVTGGGLRTFALYLFGWMLGTTIGVYVTHGKI